MNINEIINEELKERIEKLINDYNNNCIDKGINYYVDDWGELLDTVEYLLEKLKNKNESEENK